MELALTPSCIIELLTVQLGNVAIIATLMHQVLPDISLPNLPPNPIL